MTAQIVPDAPAEERPVPPAAPTPRISPALVAIVVWVGASTVGYLLPHATGISSTGLRGWIIPLGFGGAAGLSVLGVVALLSRRQGRLHAPEWLAGATAGLFGAWVVCALSTALRGTPFPFYGLIGDAGRVTAMATRYSVTWFSSDMIVPGLPAEYPPLFPWLVGRTAAALDFPAWRLVGHFEVVVTGLAVLVGYLLWQRLVPAWLAVAVTVAGFTTYGVAAKPYEVVTLALFIPWAIATFGRPPRGRLHWLAAGLVGGVIVLAYYGWLVFGGLGLLALIVSTWRAEADRRRYLVYLVKVVAVAAVVASPFLVPLLVGKVTAGGQSVADLYGSSGFLNLFFPFLQLTLLGLLQLVGLLGLVFLRLSWWARPLTLLIAGAYAYQVIGTLVLAVNQHSLLAQYAPTVYVAAFTIAGVLTLVEAVPAVLRRLSVQTPRAGALIALSLSLAWAGYTYTLNWMPYAGGVFSTFSERAFNEPLPDGGYVLGAGPADALAPWFPVGPIERDVTRVLGPNPHAVTLSVDERLFSYLPWPGYTGNDLGSSPQRTFDRLAEIRKLEATPDAEFARASSRTAFGPIDVFVLKIQDGSWQWTSHLGYNQLEAYVNFRPAQFDAATWDIDDQLPGGYVVAVRRP